ncbi:MAG: glycosyltransferase family 4 protein [bacterium]
MKSIQIISKQGPYGAEHIFIAQVKALKESGHEFIVVTKEDKGWVSDRLKALGIEFIPLSLKSVKDLFILRKTIKAHRIDLIHSMLDRADNFAFFLSFLCRVPIVTTSMVPRTQFIFRFFDKVICLSNKQRRFLHQSGIRENNIEILYPYVDIERFSNPIQRKKEAWEKKLNVVRYDIILSHVSSLIERKNHLGSVRIVVEMRKQGANPLLIIVGGDLESDYHHYLLEEIDRLNLKEHVFFTGWTDDISELLNISNFLLLPSRDEALGIVLMEGLAAGNVLVVTQGEGGEDLLALDDDIGILYSEGNEPEIARDMLQRHISRRSVEISKRCREIAKVHFSQNKYVNQLLSLYEGINV